MHFRFEWCYVTFLNPKIEGDFFFFFDHDRQFDGDVFEISRRTTLRHHRLLATSDQKLIRVSSARKKKKAKKKNGCSVIIHTRATRCTTTSGIVFIRHGLFYFNFLYFRNAEIERGGGGGRGGEGGGIKRL